ncbi:hypothetical protein BTO05_01100 [Winogradskyella sp. PC-19]|uniref:hypothetical protein n=1 Tax=Winogradskyella sp. PC-19 TaxID=754417 RepID=UPI000B3C251F|nr:hypothetical protein [Winogradskyella sp. PC-19]ARV08304.1 hypothetical protein BTO05_01100 [Winogradskyella sp. PC-19]
MKNYFFLILISLIFFSCKNKENENTKTEIKEVKPNIETKAVKEKIELTKVEKESLNAEKNTTGNWTHPEFFEFKKYKEYRITDTISIDLNGNGILERVYFDKKDCPKLIIEEKGQNPISIGCGKEEYKGFPNAIGWVNLWCVVYDKETFEIIVEDGELIGDKTVNLERPSIYVGKEEAGGGIITYKNGKLYWIHQSD